MRCGSCMVGCRHGAKNTLVKNYLWFAEKLGVEIEPERQVTEIRPLGAADGSGGYEVTSERSGSWLRQRRPDLTAKGVIVAAGALGTNSLLANCRHSGALPRLSSASATSIRTNSESIQSVTATDDERDFSRSVAITSSIYPDPDTHIEVVTYGQARRRDERHLHRDDRARHEADPAAEVVVAMLRHPLQTLRMRVPAQMVPPHGDPAGYADRRRGDAPAAEAQAARARRAPADRAGPRTAPTRSTCRRPRRLRAGSRSGPAASPRAP